MKILCVKQYKCTIFMNSQQACINGNSILLGTSSTCVKATKCTETSHGKGEGELDIPTGEKTLNKHFICNEFTLIYPSSYIHRNWTEMSKNIVPTYSDISIDMHTCNIYMICQQQAKYDLSDSIMFNISVSSVLTDVTPSTSDMRTTCGMAEDTTSGKRNICKTLRNNTIR